MKLHITNKMLNLNLHTEKLLVVTNIDNISNLYYVKYIAEFNKFIPWIVFMLCINLFINIRRVEKH